MLKGGGSTSVGHVKRARGHFTPTAVSRSKRALSSKESTGEGSHRLTRAREAEDQLPADLRQLGPPVNTPVGPFVPHCRTRGGWCPGGKNKSIIQPYNNCNIYRKSFERWQKIGAVESCGRLYTEICPTGFSSDATAGGIRRLEGKLLGVAKGEGEIAEVERLEKRRSLQAVAGGKGDWNDFQGSECLSTSTFAIVLEIFFVGDHSRSPTIGHYVLPHEEKKNESSLKSI